MPIGNTLITPAPTNAGEMHDPKMSGGNVAHGVMTEPGEPKMPVLTSYLHNCPFGHGSTKVQVYNHLCDNVQITFGAMMERM